MNFFWSVVQGTPMNEPDKAPANSGVRAQRRSAAPSRKATRARGTSALLLTEVLCAAFARPWKAWLRTFAALIAATLGMVSVVDETDDDWQAITALGSWDDFLDAYFQRKCARRASAARS